MVSGLCCGIAAFLLIVLSGSGQNTNGNLYELDAIAAAIIGGTALTGGRYFLAGTVVGALTIQTLTTSVYSLGVSPQSALLFKAIVVTIVCLIQAPKFRAKFALARRRSPTPPAASDGKLERTAGVAA